MSTVSRLGDLVKAGVEDGVARDPEHAVLLLLPRERKPDHVAHERAAQPRSVPTRRGGHFDHGLPRCLEPDRLPRHEAPSLAAEALRSSRRRYDGGHTREQRPPCRVQVVGVMVVGEQHRVDRPKVGRRDRRLRCLARASPVSEGVRSPRRVEGRVGQQPPAAHLDQDGRAADVSDDNVHGPVAISAQHPRRHRTDVRFAAAHEPFKATTAWTCRRASGSRSGRNQRPNQRARRVAPNSAFSAAYASEGSLRAATGDGPPRKLTSTLLTSPSPNSA